MKDKLVRILSVLFLIITQVGCDQVSKKIVREKIEYHENISIYKDNLILTKVENEGAFLSLGSELPPGTRAVVLSIFPAIIVLLAFWFLISQKDLTNSLIIGLSCIIGGGIGNLIDRILYGSVTDFMHINLGGIFRTGIFNVADLSIMAGIFLTMIPMLFSKAPAESPKENQ
ncbi:MAG: signal peptidase II [Bacteroidia bacterium]|nr:signal peptidase II [Bacteroidia bacterium]